MVYERRAILVTQNRKSLQNPFTVLRVEGHFEVDDILMSLLVGCHFFVFAFIALCAFTAAE